MRMGTKFPRTPEVAHRYYRLLKAAQRKFAMARFEMGVLLHTLKANDLWVGFAESFNDFLAQERINPNAARQYMRVAKRLYFELNLTDLQFEALADVSFSVLDKACSVIDDDNKEDMIALLSSLDSRDAEHELGEIKAPSDPARQHPRVAKILSEIRDLPHEYRIEVMQQLGLRQFEQGRGVASGEDRAAA